RRTGARRSGVAGHRRTPDRAGRANSGGGRSDDSQPDLWGSREVGKVREGAEMSCQECELLLAAGGEAAEHLLTCAACRALAEELRANSEALLAMRDEALVIIPVPRARARWAWAAAAAVLVAFALWRME